MIIFHVWSMSDDIVAMSAHVKAADGVDCHDRQVTLDGFCREQFHIVHTTIQTTHDIVSGH